MAFQMDMPEADPDELEWTARTVGEPKPKTVRIVIEGSPADTATIETFARLLLGGTMEGSQEFAKRLNQWQSASDAQAAGVYTEAPDETDGERLRYALIGLLSRAPQATQRMVDRALRASDTVYLSLSDFFMPVTDSRVLSPFQRRYDALAARGQVAFEGWVDTGRRAEQRSRALARQAAFDGTDEAIDEMVGLLGDKPAVRELVLQQSTGMVEEVLTVVRDRTASADSVWERRIHRFFRRS